MVRENKSSTPQRGSVEEARILSAARTQIGRFPGVAQQCACPLSWEPSPAKGRWSARTSVLTEMGKVSCGERGARPG